jgi:hypothetical protein
MDAERHRRACEVFEAVCDAAEDTRGVLLQSLCAGDAELRRQVDAMLAADAVTSSDVDTGAADAIARSLARDLAGTESASTEAGPLPDRIGEFRVVRRLGSGGMGVVYEAEQEHPRRRVAIKVVHSWLQSEAFLGRFHREVEVLGGMLHPGIPQVYQAGTEGDRPYLVMERVEGEPLDRWIASNRPGVRRRIGLVAAICDAVHHAHERGIVHCDLKPGNVLVSATGAPKVLDFGVAAPAHLAGDETAPPMGTPSYMSPEQLRGERVLDARSDVFALGVLAYETFAGRVPFPAARSGRAEGLAAIEAGPPPLPGRPSLLRRDLDAVCRKAMALRPERRYETAAAFRADLLRSSSHRPVQARRSTTAYRLHAFVVRRRAALAAVAAAALAVGALAAGVGLVRDRARARAAAEAEEAARSRLTVAMAQVDHRLAERDPEGAAAAFRAFLEDPTNQGRAALPEGWLRYGGRLDVAGREEEARDAFARAYVGTSDRVVRREALGELARILRRRWEWSALGAVLRRLDAAGGLAPGDRRIRADRAAAGRDLAAAARLLADAADPTAPLAAALSSGRPLGIRPESLHPVDVDGDGRDEVVAWIHQEHRLEIRAGDAGFRRLGILRFPEGTPLPHRVWSLPGPPPTLVIQHDGRDGREGPTAIYPLAPGPPGDATLRPRWQGNVESLLSVAAADVDGDGRPEIYLGTGPYSRRLIRLTAVGDGAWVASSPHPGTDAIASDLLAIAAADVDSDGRDEIWVSAGAWRAYDVRVLTSVPGREDLRLSSRRRLGAATSLLPWRSPVGRAEMLVAVSARYASAEQFGADFPFAGPAGLYGLRPSASGIDADRRAVFECPVRGAANDEWRIRASGDFDGDGLRDLAISGETGRGLVALVLRGLADGGFGPLLLGQVMPMCALQLDDDPADELVVTFRDRDEEAWALGCGDTRPAPWVESEPSSPATAPRLPSGEPFRRVADLVEIGLVPVAAELLAAAADVANDSGRAAEARVWAASLEMAAGHGERAGLLLDRVADPRGVGPETRRERARLLARLHRYAAAVEAYEALSADPDAAGGDRDEVDAALAWLRPQIAAVASIDLRFDRPLSAAWRILEPGAVRRDRRRGVLDLDVFGGGRAVAVLPVRLVGPRVAIRGRLAVREGEFGAGLAVHLRSTDAPETSRIGLSLTYTGGGGFTDRAVRCEPPGRHGLIEDVRRIGPDGSAETIAFEIVHVPATGETRCVLGWPRSGDVREAATSAAYALPGEAWELAIEAAGDGRYGAGMRLRASLESLRLEGAEIVPEDGPAAPLALADGDPEAALAGADPSDPLPRAYALLELGHVGDAAGAAAAAHVAGDPRLPALVRSSDPVLTLPLLERLGPGFLELYEWSWRECFNDPHHGSAWRSLAVLPADALDGGTPAQRRLLLCRARAAWDAGRPAEAAAALRRLVERADPGEGSLRTEAHLLLASIAAASGRTAEAAAQVRAFVASSATREEAEDRLRREPLLADFSVSGAE